MIRVKIIKIRIEEVIGHIFSIVNIFLYHLMIMITFFSPITYCTANINDFNENTKTSIVQKHGKLRIKCNQLINEKDEPVVLTGMSLFWSQWMGKYYNYDCIKWLRDDWKCTVIRASMGVEMDGYLTKPEIEMAKIKTVIDACIDLGIYVIVDWHDHNAHNHTEKAVEFFNEIANLYGDKPNIIYEIYNEPQKISWDKEIKPYAEKVINNIRLIDSNNVIIIGTSSWSQDVDISSRNPLEYNNIAYALHFYAATHAQLLRAKTQEALTNGTAVFVSEFGTCEANGSGIINYEELQLWFDFMDINSLSWCNWSISDKDETSAALKPGANPKGGWTENDLTISGKIIREKLRLLNENYFDN